MIERILAEKVNDYRPANVAEQESTLQELMQHFVLASLARARFFSTAAFHGGTYLRILYNANRFSEDLDFLLQQPDSDFQWLPYLERVRKDCVADGIHFEVQDRSMVASNVRKAFLKTDSIGQIMRLSLPFDRHPAKKIRIKLEIDTNPPAGSIFETRYITFPMTTAITTQTLASSFSTKSHALLCREYTKGRDWYDFLWYIEKKVAPELQLLANALDQQGPWAGKKVRVTADWYVEALRRRIEAIHWQEAQADVLRFVTEREQESIALWSRDLFLSQLERLAGYLCAG
jgi:predicted nucleotidyltransferase component of viral defense system